MKLKFVAGTSSIMHITTKLSLWALAIGSAAANIQIEYFPDSVSCRDGNAAEILHYQRESGGNCIKRSPDNNHWKIRSTDEDDQIRECTLYRDSACTEPVFPSGGSSYKCDHCASGGENTYIWIE